MLTQDQVHQGFDVQGEGNGLFTLVFLNSAVATQLEEEVLGVKADEIWVAFLRQRRTFIDEDGEIE